MVNRFVLWGLVLLVLASCSPMPTLTRNQVLSPVPPQEQIFVVPFTTVMVPQEVEEGIFDRFVDALNAGGAANSNDFVILKQGLAAIDPAWLAERYYITGEVFAYVEESGCCATTIRVRSRLHLFQPDSVRPALTLEYPREIYFEHDYTTVSEERRKLAADIATTLVERLLESLSDH